MNFVKKLLSKTNKKEIFKVKYYTNKDDLLGTLYTVCLLLDNNNKILSRGVSICSLLDSYNKTTGKNKSYGRALKALKNKQSYYPIKEDVVGRRTFEKRLFCTRSFRVKNSNKKRIAAFEFVIPKSLGFKIDKRNINEKDITEFKINYPIAFPINQAAKEFRYKSEYNPKATNYELTFTKK